jgi:cation diffusion facilitator family transporter
MVNNKTKKVRNVLIIIMFANIFVAILKIIIGNMIKSSSMVADGFHSLSDGSSNVVGLIGIWIASKPVDDDHPYGHRKFETLAGLFIGGMLLVVGVNISISAFQRFVNPVVPNISVESLVTLIITLGINIVVSKVEYKEGKKLSSQILISDSMHTRSDIYVSIGVLITLVCIKIGLPPVIDSIASLIVAMFIFHAAYEIFKETSGVLVDKVAVNTDKISKLVLEFSEVKNVHHIRSRGREDELYIDLHVMTEPSMSVEESHVLQHSIQEKLRDELCENAEVFVHIEPYYPLVK